MKKWDQLFIRTGWMLEKRGENTFSCIYETELNREFLLQCLNKAGISHQYEKGMLILLDHVISEQKWLEAIDFFQRGVGGYWFEPSSEVAKLQELDKYIAGFVRQLNRLGFLTTGSCDGHGENSPYIMFSRKVNKRDIEKLLNCLGVKYRIRDNQLHYHVKLFIPREKLLDLAEKLSTFHKEWLSFENEISIKKEMFFQLLEQLLEINGESGNEKEVRQFVFEALKTNVDHITIDKVGNILAEKTYGNGVGPVILLNAHLDTFEKFVNGREMIKDGSTWFSSEGILGADDRAGVAILLYLAEYLSSDSNFNGKIKFIFTVQEEQGLIGARNVNETFLWGVDGAIVVDRRGTGDIVTSCGQAFPFCHEKYGAFFEKMAKHAQLSGWKMTPGGSSDTKIWASRGIQSVNLSAGYFYEHTNFEKLNIEAAFETVKLLLEVFNHSREFMHVIREIRNVEKRAN